MYIINYKNHDSEYYSGIAISRFIPNNEISYDITEDEYAYKYINLMPERNFEGKIESEEKIREYIRYYYVDVLSKLDPDNVYGELKYNRLVTFGDGEFSHGYVVAAWFELFLGVQVKCVDNDVIFAGKLNDAKPKWVIDILEEEIKKTIDNMKGFNSVRALYLFNQGEELERMANELEKKIFNNNSLSREQVYRLSDRVNGYRQEACFRRCDADMAEDVWIERRTKLVEDIKKKNRRKD